MEFFQSASPLSLVSIFLLTYLLAAMPFAYWLGLAFGKNLLEEGSKSSGATNALRVLGKWQAILVLLLDIAKGFLPVYLAKNFIAMNPWLLLVLVIVPILAHSKSIYIGFKGGKSSATGFGVLLAINWIVALITIAIWISAVFISKYSSMGSIVCIPLVPLWLYLFGENLAMISFGVIAFIYIVLIKHKANIRRLLDGTEPKIGEKK